MLKLLSISNLAIISHTQVEFGNGLNILSGETGAGKSIILVALGLLLGDRASQDMLRTGEAKAIVEGVFEVAGNVPLLALLEEAGIDIEGGDLVIKREIVANGRGKVFVNNQAGTINLLKTIQPHIIDVHGQGEQQSLLSTTSQTQLLDAFAGNEVRRTEIADLFDRLSLLVKELAGSRKTEAERLQLLDLVNYQLQEIDRLNPRPNEDIELETERRLLLNAEKLSILCNDITQLLYDDDAAVVGKIALAQRRMDELCAIDLQFEASAEQLNNAKYLLEDVAFAIRNFADRITFSPERLQLIDDRLNSFDRIKRKYGGSITDVVVHLVKLKGKQLELQNNEAHEEGLVSQLQEIIRSYSKASRNLTKVRQAAARELESLLKKDLLDVALEKARLIIYFNPATLNSTFLQLQQRFGDLSQDIGFSRVGNETVELYFSANKGEDARPLSTVASGGELSRLMLILKTNIAPSPYPRTLVFDEIDAGIGGRVAEAIGIRLKKLAKSNQVICVTHQAQIARYADIHLQVAKEIKGQRTLTRVVKLEAKDRVRELARMIAGTNLTDVSLQHAKELLQV